MKDIQESFSKFKQFVFDILHNAKSILAEFSIQNIKSMVKFEYNTLRAKLSDLKGTNWNLAQYHFVAGNFNDGILRFKMLQRSNYKVMECNYFLGRIYLEKLNYKDAEKYLSIYLNSNHNDYRDEANYCMNILQDKEIKYIPQSIILQKRNRLALNLEKTSMDYALLNRYNIIIESLRSILNPSVKILEIGCYIGILGRILKETFVNNIQYLAGSEMGEKVGEIAKSMHIGIKPAYDSVKICQNILDLGKNDNTYGIILVPDFLSYYGELTQLFIQIFTSLNDNGVCIIVARMIDHIITPEEPKQDFVFIGAIEEFSYSQEYIKNTATACGLKLKSDISISDEFQLFVFSK